MDWCWFTDSCNRRFPIQAQLHPQKPLIVTGLVNTRPMFSTNTLFFQIVYTIITYKAYKQSFVDKKVGYIPLCPNTCVCPAYSHKTLILHLLLQQETQSKPTRLGLPAPSTCQSGNCTTVWPWRGSNSGRGAKYSSLINVRQCRGNHILNIAF